MIKTNIGGVSLEVNYGVLKAETSAKAMEKLVGSMIFHDAASKAFGKKSAFKRDAAYSQAKADHVKLACEQAIGVYFEGVSVEASEHVAVVNAVSAERIKLHASMKGIVPEDILKANFPEFYKVETKEVEAPEPESESDTEAVG